MKFGPTILCALAVATSVTAATIPVAGSIQRAYDLAKDGDTLLVNGPTVFHEHIKITKRVQLIGTNNPVIDADASGSALRIEAEGVQVRGITVRNGGVDLGAPDAGILIRASKTVIENVRVEGGGFGIYLRASDNCRIANNVIVGNTNIENAKRGNGIHLWKSKNNAIVNNFVTGSRDGMYFSYADQNIIASNRVEHTRFGIHYMYSHHNQLRCNTLTANSVGAALMFARDCVVEDNRAFANKRHGILLKQVESSRFIHNAVYGQNRGFFIQQAALDRFEENLVCENDIGLYLSNGSEKNVFVGNAFVRNNDQIWQPSDEVEMGRLASNNFHENHRGNFWSDYTGNDNDGNGIGDTPYHETDVLGYIVDRHPEARVFALSPAASLLRKSEEVLPLLDVQGVTDPFPLMNPSADSQAKFALLHPAKLLVKATE
ncbi:MAG: nitrous oxide reductase family maturation protein NosD [Limisphaerales bacterium]